MKLFIVVLSFILLVISTLTHHHSEICCMFGANQYYGWPNAYLTLTKTTSDYNEAKKVETNSMIYLLKNGWEMKFSTHYMGLYGLTTSPLINLTLNYLFFAIPISITSGLLKIVKQNKS
jgi:hypothetical protein